MRDYAELVKALQLCPNSCRGCPRLNTSEPFTECKAKLNRDAADAIEELLAKVPQWISVEERLPEKSKIVLVAYDNGVVAQGMLFFGKFRGANFGFDENDEPIIAEVTHWMPLPLPPKEDAECKNTRKEARNED